MVIRSPSTDRHFALEGCFNFRDLGGHQTTTGASIRWRRLFRSDSLHDLTPGDGALLRRLGVVTVIDLRTPEEVDSLGACLLGEVCVGAPMHGATMPVHGRGLLAEASAVAMQYGEMLEHNVDAVREVMAVLTDPSLYPAVLQCPAGHDRTGLVAAMILGMLGVADDLIVDDYAASRRAIVGRPPAGSSMPARHLLRHGPTMLGVTPETMRAFLALVRVRYGSFEGYAEAIDMRGAMGYLRAALLTA